MIESFDFVFYTLAFVVPGFLLEMVLRKFIPKEIKSDSHNLINYLSFSILNYAIWSWLIYLLFKNEYFTTNSVASALTWGGIIFIGPIVIAVAILLLHKFKVLVMLSSFFKLNPIHPIPTAWDYKFSSVKNKKWVIVILDNDVQIAGIWWTNSFASSISNERDIYLEEVYSVLEDGSWEKVSRTDGMYIKGEKIRLIQFWNDEIKEE